MMMDVENIIDERIDPYELEKFRDSYETQVRRGHPSAVATFSYAHALIKSTKTDVHIGINLLERLLREESEDVSKRDYVYYLAIANARLKDYDRALAYLDILLSAESHNRQAVELKDVIQRKMKKDGLLGMAILGGGAVVVGGLLAALMAAKK